MGNFNLKSIWKQTGGTGGSTNLEQRVQAIENGYFKKEGGTLQRVNNSTEFYANVVLKQNGYVDHVDTNGPTSMINKQYLEQQLNTTKEYVDNRIKKRVLTITNTAGNTYTIQPTQGYEIISVMVGRKRTAEGYYFFNYQSSLNFQLFMDSSGTYKLYTEGAVSGFNGDYKIIVVEMKV